LKNNNYPVEYTEEVINQPVNVRGKGGSSSGGGAGGRDPEFEDAVRIVCQFNQASASFLQRKMSIGYAKAARIIDQLVEAGVVGHADGAKPRDILISDVDAFLNGSSTPQE
jgi:S-DNA-T family DNA segregation ATPase FtsK/SpoIIIE